MTDAAALARSAEVSERCQRCGVLMDRRGVSPAVALQFCAARACRIAAEGRRRWVEVEGRELAARRLEAARRELAALDAARSAA